MVIHYGHSSSSCTWAKQCFAKPRSWDNAPTERFFRSFKIVWMPKGGFEDIAEASNAISDYIWGYYQTVRPHSFNNYLPPAEKERRYFNQNLLSGVLN
ncbi:MULTISPECIES: integrase core domain-containing protein [Psychrobacter]|uniref:integrase core domain-containing protein n=2 Tax=Moraxellaceae TaxID=468 RepID=UPI0009ED0B9F